MATGDIIAASIDSTGSFAYITVEGWASSAGNITYSYGDVANGAGYVKFTVVSEGYNDSGTLGTVTRTVFAYKTVRKAKPNDASLDEVVSGSDLVIRVALQNDIYDDDKNGGAGTSGTDPALTITAGSWAVSSSPSRTNNGVTALGVTNNSALDYPVAFGGWDIYAGTLHRSRVKSSLTLAFHARHAPGVATVRFNAVGGTSAVDTESWVTVQTATKRTATNLYACSYMASVSLTPYTQGETITSRCRIYPLVGDANAVFDTSGRTTADDEPLGFNEHVVICDKNNALDVIRYLSSTGNDSTGDGSSGNPWLTPEKALRTATVNVVRLKGSATFDLTFSGSRRAISEWCVFEPDSGATPTVRMVSTSLSARQFNLERLMFSNLTITKTNNNSYLDGADADNFLAFVNCVFDDGGFGGGSNPGPGYKSNACYVINCTGDLNYTAWRITSFSSTRNAYLFDGVAFDADTTTGVSLNAWYRTVACSGINASFIERFASNPAPTMAGTIFECNLLLDSTLASGNVLYFSASITGLSVIGNMIKKTAGTAACVSIFGDNTSGTANHVIIAHNTGVGTGNGRRWNLFYNDRGTTPYPHKHVFVQGNHIDEGNIKSDKFAHNVVSITRSGSTATVTLNASDASAAYTAGQSVYVSGATQPEYNGTFTIASTSGATSGGTITYAVSGTPTTPATGTISCFGLGRVGNWPQLYGVNWRANNIDTLTSVTFDWEELGIDGTRATPSFVDAASNDYTPAAADALLNRVSNPYIPRDLYGRKFVGSAAIGARQIVTQDVAFMLGAGTMGMVGG